MNSRNPNYILTRGQTWRSEFKATDPEGCDVTTHVDGPTADWFISQVAGAWGQIEVRGEVLGAWKIQVTARDECGGERVQQQPILVVPDSAGGDTVAEQEPGCESRLK